MAKLKWQIEIDEDANSFSNEELLSEVMSISGGDDYDGCFTTRGEYKLKVYKTELEKRLTDIGFLT